MKRLIILALCLACSLMAVAQQENNNPKVKVGVRVGGVGSCFIVPQNEVISLNPQNSKPKRPMKIGLTAGVTVDIPISQKLNLQTGLMYSLQRAGEKDQCIYNIGDTNYSVDSKITYKSHHIKLPLMILFQGSNKPNHFVAGVGVFADVALGGKLRYDASAVLTPGGKYLIEGDLNPYNKENQYLRYRLNDDDFWYKHNLGYGSLFKRFNFGISAEIGYQISKVYLGAHIDFGVLNMARPEMCGENYRQRPLNVQVLIGYNIN